MKNRHRTPHRPRSGFTLIELSIVLVIIGLIVGGIMMGKDIMEVARVHRQVAQIQKISAAANAFKTKYNALPGDLCAKAPSFGLKCGNAAGTRDNGRLDDMRGWNPILETAYEPVYFFGHLVDAGLLANDWVCQNMSPGNPSFGFYANAIHPDSGMVATTHMGRTVLFLGINRGPSTCSFLHVAWVSDGGVMTPSEAYAMDVKLDDGVAGTGGFYATMFTGLLLAGAVDNIPGQCVADPTAQAYNISNESRVCRIMVLLQ